MEQDGKGRRSGLQTVTTECKSNLNETGTFVKCVFKMVQA